MSPCKRNAERRMARQLHTPNPRRSCREPLCPLPLSFPFGEQTEFIPTGGWLCWFNVQSCCAVSRTAPRRRASLHRNRSAGIACARSSRCWPRARACWPPANHGRGHPFPGEALCGAKGSSGMGIATGGMGPSKRSSGRAPGSRPLSRGRIAHQGGHAVAEGAAFGIASRARLPGEWSDERDVSCIRACAKTERLSLPPPSSL